MPHLGKLLGNILDNQDAERIRAKGLLQGLKGDVPWRSQLARGVQDVAYETRVDPWRRMTSP